MCLKVKFELNTNITFCVLESELCVLTIKLLDYFNKKKWNKYIFCLCLCLDLEVNFVCFGVNFMCENHYLMDENSLIF